MLKIIFYQMCYGFRCFHAVLTSYLNQQSESHVLLCFHTVNCKAVLDKAYQVICSLNLLFVHLQSQFAEVSIRHVKISSILVCQYTLTLRK